MNSEEHVDLTDPQKLHNVLELLSANSSEVIKRGEKLLRPFLKKRSCINHLFNQLQHSLTVSCRHHAALLIKKKIGTFIHKFSIEDNNNYKAGIINLLLNETDKGVGLAICGIIAVMAKYFFSINDKWTDLFNLLMQLSRDSDPKKRCLSYNLLEQLSEKAVTELKPHTPTLAQMFTVGCQDTDSTVAVAALVATGAYITALGNQPEVMGLSEVLPIMLQVMQNCLQAGDESTVSEVLEVVQECCILEQPLINDHIQAISAFSIAIIQSNSYDSPVRQAAGQTLMQIIECRPKLFASKELVGPTLVEMMKMIAETDSSALGTLFSFDQFKVHHGDDEDDDDEDYSPEMDVQKMSQTLIDCMAIHIPSKYFVETAIQLCAQGISSLDPKLRKAGCAVLGIIAEGCCDSLRQILPNILPPLLNMINDPEQFVREIACFTLGQFSEHCQPEILYHNESVLPAIFQALDDQHNSVKTTSCYVLEVFCENLKPSTLRPYLMPLMTKLGQLLQSPDRVAKDMALTAIAACAVAAEKDFLPFTQVMDSLMICSLQLLNCFNSQPVCQLLCSAIFDSEPANFSTRGRAMECLGHIAVAVGREHFSPYFEQGLQSAVQGTTLRDETLKEHSYVFVANCAKVMGDAFNPYLPTLVPHLCEVIGESEISAITNLEDDTYEDDDEADADLNEAENEDDDSSGNRIRLNVEEGFINTKKAAIIALGALAEHTREAFYPYIKDALEVLLTDGTGAINSLHEAVRGEAYNALQFFVKVACVTGGIVETPLPGTVITLPPAVVEVTRVALNANITCIMEDDEKLPVAESCASIIGILDLIGMATLQLQLNEEGHLVIDALMNAIKTILDENSSCQKAATNAADRAEDDDDDHDNTVMDTVTDLIGILAKIMKNNFIPYFDEFQKSLMKFSKPTRPFSDRAMCIGCFAEVVAEIGPGAVNYAPILLPLTFEGLQDPMESVRRNSAFCIGALIESTGSALSSNFLLILQKLHPICFRSEDQKKSDRGGADIDNALSTVARIITNAPDGLIPLDQVLPVIIASLPLQEDFGEGPNIYQCIGTLMLKGDNTIINHLPQVLTILAETLLPTSNAVEKTKLITKVTLQQMQNYPAFSNLLPNTIASISNPDIVQVLRSVLSQ